MSTDADPADEAGDDLDAFVAEHSRRLVGLVALHIGDRAVAEELAQEALARLCSHWSKVRTMDRPDAWLSRVAINLANSSLRRRYAGRRAKWRHGPDRDPGPPEHADVLAVREAVSALPRKQRTALVLRYYAQLSVAETAAEMGCPEGTVKSLTHRAIAALRERGGLLEGDDR